jgi:NAD(P)-dependent dehydrogenase (short-subunit alcohol dehydrogenase family)
MPVGRRHTAPDSAARRITFVVVARAGYSSSFAYGASKAAVIQLSKVVAMELAERNVRVNTVSPGPIATGIFGKVFGMDLSATDETAEILARAFGSAQPIPRAGMPNDIAEVAAFLASDDSGFLTAQDIVVDGGLMGGCPFSTAQAAFAGIKKALGIDDA